MSPVTPGNCGGGARVDRYVIGARRDPVALVAYACCLLVSAVLAAGIVAGAVQLGADLVARGQGLRVVSLTTVTAAVLAVPAAPALLVVRAARGSARALRGAATSTGCFAAVGAVGLAMYLPVAPFLWWLGGVPAALGAAHLLLRWAARRLPPAPADPRPLVAVRPVPAGGLEEAAAGPPYPYPQPLPAAARRAHLDAMWSRQMSMNVWGFVLLVPGVIAVVTSIVWGNGRSSRGESDLWHTHPALALGLHLGGLLAVAAATGAIVRLARSKNRHVRLLKAYGVPLDRLGQG